MPDEELIRNLERDLERLTEDLTPLERALYLAKGFSEVYGEKWTIEMRADGGFTIKKDASNAR